MLSAYFTITMQPCLATVPALQLYKLKITGRRPAELQAFKTSRGRQSALQTFNLAVYYKLSPKLTRDCD
jgi:hypothetical protein